MKMMDYKTDYLGIHESAYRKLRTKLASA